MASVSTSSRRLLHSLCFPGRGGRSNKKWATNPIRSFSSHHEAALLPRPRGLSFQQQRQHQRIVGYSHYSWNETRAELISHRSWFSTDTTDRTPQSTAELKEGILQCIRNREVPHRAHDMLKQILLKQQQQEPIADLAHIQTSMIDAWMKYQSSLLEQAKEAVKEEKEELAFQTSATNTTDNQKDLQQQQLQLLKEAHSVATSVNEIVESMQASAGGSSSYAHCVVANLKTWATVCELAHLIGKTKLDLVVGIPQRTQHILNQQQQSSSSPPPSVEAYNQVIRAWACSSEYLRGTMAEQVFQQIDYPNGESFQMIIRAHAWSNERRSAFQATGHFMRMMRLLEIGKGDMEPASMDDYHILCHAWTKAGDKNSPSKVHTVLEIMDMAFRKGLTQNLRPDLQCYRDALKCMSQRHNVTDVGDLADETLRKMKDQMIYPDTECYRYAILAWKHVAMGRDSPFPEQAIYRTQELLQEMTEAYHRTTVVTVRPTTEDYNHVLEALMLSKSSKAIDRAKKLFQKLKNEDSDNTIGFQNGPDPQTYRYMLEVWHNSRSPDKLSHAVKLLQELKVRALEDDSWKKRPLVRDSIVDAFTAFIRVCGSVGRASKKELSERTTMMTMALRSVKDLNTLGLSADAGTYTALIEACDHLLHPDEQERQNVMENVFRRACEEGHVNPSLLEQFRSSASAYLYAKMVVAQSVQVEQTKVVPESWTRNVKGFKEGKKVMPLSIHGTFTFTKAAAEYRTRKLRRRTNQKMLRGGRLK